MIRVHSCPFAVKLNLLHGKILHHIGNRLTGLSISEVEIEQVMLHIAGFPAAPFNALLAAFIVLWRAQHQGAARVDGQIGQPREE